MEMRALINKNTFEERGGAYRKEGGKSSHYGTF